jgi:hypothetical protein
VTNVCCWRNSGKHLLLASISHIDPKLILECALISLAELIDDLECC